MAKPLSDILKGVKASKTEPGSTGTDPGVDYAPKAPAEQDVVKKHKTEKHADRVGNGDDVYQATNIKHSQIKDTKHGYKNPEDQKVNEEAKCNMTAEGTHCPVHEMSSCTSKPKKTLRELRKGFNEGSEDGAGSTEEDLDENAKGYATKTKVLDAIKSLSQEHAKKHPNDFFIVHHSAEKIGQKAGVSADTVHKHMKSGVQGYASKRLSGGKLGYRYVGESLAVPLVGGDDESAEMAKTQLRALANKAMALAMYLSDDMVVEPWVQAKIAVAKDQVTAVHDYMVYGDKKEQTAPNDTPITFPGMNVDAEVGARL